MIPAIPIAYVASAIVVWPFAGLLAEFPTQQLITDARSPTPGIDRARGLVVTRICRAVLLTVSLPHGGIIGRETKICLDGTLDMAAHIEGKELNMQSLLDERPQRTELAIYTVHKADMGKLQGLDRLPLETLELRWLSAPDMTDVPLPPDLRSLMIWHCSKLRSLNGLEAAPQLQHLALEDNAPLEDASSLGALKHLTACQSSVVSPQIKKSKASTQLMGCRSSG